jgi:hypothetical protein
MKNGTQLPGFLMDQLLLTCKPSGIFTLSFTLSTTLLLPTAVLKKLNKPNPTSISRGRIICRVTGTIKKKTNTEELVITATIFRFVISGTGNKFTSPLVLSNEAIIH